MPKVRNLPESITYQLWEYDIKQRPALARFFIHIGRMIFGVVRKFVDGDFSMRAMSLVYTTLLSIVPLLALSFSVLKGFGVHNQLEPTLLEFLEPLGERKTEIVTSIVDFVENLRLGALSAMGIVMLLYTIIAMTIKVERAFNDIWHVAKPRTLARRFADYLSMIMVGPVLIFSGFSLTHSLLGSSVVQWFASIEPFGTLLYGVSLLVPYAMVCVAFTFLYGFIPNTRVRFMAALVGGVFAGLLWSTASVIFANLVVNSSSYSAIYAGFASVVLFMVWIYIGWLIVLVGGQVSFYWQNRRFLDPRTENTELSNRESEEAAIELMTLIGRAYRNNEAPWSFERLDHHRTDIQPDALLKLLRLLEASGMIVSTGANPAIYLPARAIDTIYLKDILQLVRGRDNIATQSIASVAGVMDSVDSAINQALGEKTLLDLIVTQNA